MLVKLKKNIKKKMEWCSPFYILMEYELIEKHIYFKKGTIVNLIVFIGVFSDWCALKRPNLFVEFSLLLYQK